MGIGGQGRPSKLTSLKILEGDRSSRINTNAPAPAVGDIRMPSWLPARAKRLWQALAPDLQHREVLTPWDVPLLAQWCVAAAQARDAATHLAQEGEVIAGAKGRVKNPWFQVWRDSMDVMLRIGARFGLTPSDRGQLKLPEPDDAELEALLS